MLHRIHNRLGTAGLMVAVVALIAALGGTALGALPGLNTKQRKEVKKIATKVVKVGPQGAQGAPGTQGAPGSAGKEGARGLQGEPGKDGEDGACSVSVPECVLPPGATLSGRWSFIGRGLETFETEVGGIKTSHTFGSEEALVSISYLLRVLPAIEFQHQDWIGPGESSTGTCPGSYANPEAAPGHLCLYAQHMENAGEGSKHEPRLESYYNDSADRTSGYTFGFALQAGLQGFGDGSWAVTAPCPKNELGEEEEC
jgi:collagen triple helix repeat protein